MNDTQLVEFIVNQIYGAWSISITEGTKHMCMYYTNLQMLLKWTICSKKTKTDLIWKHVSTEATIIIIYNEV